MRRIVEIGWYAVFDGECNTDCAEERVEVGLFR